MEIDLKILLWLVIAKMSCHLLQPSGRVREVEVEGFERLKKWFITVEKWNMDKFGYLKMCMD